MANTPTPKSYETILGNMLSTYMAKLGVNDLNVGSAVTSFFETVAQSIYRATGDSFSILRDFNVDRASGEKLRRIAADENVTINGDKVATGSVTITDTSFNKIVTKVYAGSNPPNIGSSVIKVSDASEFPSTGSIYIGRGTSNIEGPIVYSSISSVGGYYEINLATPTTKFHNISESVILAQGGVRTINAGEVVVSPASGISSDINFTLTKQAVILDGENVITNVSVAAQIPGTDGNVPRHAIKQFTSSPFTGASVTNDSAFTTGKNADTDDEIRNNIKRARISKGLGTALAIKSAVLGAQAKDENATVTSDEIFSDGSTTSLFIDNGQGYEETSAGVGLEYIVDSALGGEYYFQLTTEGIQTSIAKAFLSSNNASPYSVVGGDKLALLVGGVLSEHIFDNSEFRSPGNATAFEIVASINGDSTLLFSANTIENGTKVVLFARQEEDEFLEITTPSSGNDVATALGLPSGEVQTLRLYKNKKPLSRNGRVAQVTSENQVNWSTSIASGDTLIISVDGTGFITYTFTDADFLAEGTHTTVNKNNTLQSWVNVINSKVTGITAAINGTQLILVSNLGVSSRASLSISESSTLVTNGMFTTTNGLTAEGVEADFTLSRNTAQFKLKNPLEAGDSLTAGTEYTKGMVQSTAFLGSTVTLISDAYLWFLIDNQDAQIINTGVTANTTITVSKPSANIIRYTSNNSTAFVNVNVGDWAIVWSTDLAAGNRMEARVYEVGSDYIDLKLTSTEAAGIVIQGPIIWNEGLTIVRTDRAVQKIKIPAGSYNINTIASLFSNSIVGATSSVENDEIINITTNTESTDGEVLVVTFDDSAKNLNFVSGDRSQSQTSLFSSYETLNKFDDFPLFVNGKIAGDVTANPPDSLVGVFISDIDLSTVGIDQNEMICMLHPHSAIQDNVSAKECAQINSISGTTVDIYDSELIRRLRVNDRYYVSSPYQFNATDTIVAILDGDTSNKTFPIPLYRRAITNNTIGIDTNNFRAYDTESGSTAEFTDFFGTDFSFQNYKAFMKAKNAINPSNPLVDEDSLLFRSSTWGRSGERINVGYVYPTAPSQDISHTIILSDITKIRINLKSGNVIADTIDGTTEWNVTVTNMGSYDEVTYTWNSVGTNPTIDSALSSGGYVTINKNGEFADENTGTFRVSSATSTSFTTIREAGVATAETNKATLTNSTIVLFASSDTSADDINTYINDNVSEWITSEILDDNGTTGSGIITKSTEEDSGFTYTGVDLKDGVNFIEVSDLTATSPSYQFRFKNSLNIPSFSTATANAYAFNAGEEVRLIPTTARQTVDFMNVLAVTGFTTAGTITTAERDENIQFKTEILGSNGALQIAGGKGNSSEAAIQQAASKIIDTNLMRATILSSASSGFYADQWVKLKAYQAQKKNTGISFVSTVTITPNSPDAGKSTITVNNRENHDIYFGDPRNFFRDRGRTFHIEKHGSLVCLSWNESGSDPVFGKTVEINDSAVTISVVKNSATGYTEYTIDSGNINFVEAQRDDVFTIAGLIDSQNNGSFLVVGVSEDNKTIVVDNNSGVDAVSASLGSGNISITATVQEGDSITLDAPFSTLNRGTFRVIRRYANSVYIENNNAIEEIITISDNLRSLGFDATTEFDIVTTNNIMRIEWNGNGTEPTLSNAKQGDVIRFGSAFASDNQGYFMVLNSGDNYIECANAKAVAESGIVVSSIGGNLLQAHNPSIKMFGYDTTIIGDTFTISGNVFDGDNIGSYQVVEVLNRNSIVVSSLLESKTNILLEDKYTQVYIQEGLLYEGYKKIYNLLMDPSNTSRSIVVFDSNNQYLKVNKDAGDVYMTAMGKLNFPTTIKKGLDSYRYNTGLIAEANRIVYGDPRDNVTYAGVAAAGAEIFIKAPLKKRIKIGVGVRLNTGIPFSKIIEQVRSNISALVNSSDIGQSIAISDIISVVNSIPGVKAVSITSPSYDITNDVIVVNPSEKALILDIVNDITISKVG